MQTDPEIMTRVQAGETSLFAELVSRYQTRLQRFAFSKLGHTQLAEDLVQETFLAAFQARMSYSPEFAFSTWIWTILLNLSRNAYRKRNVETEHFKRYRGGLLRQLEETDAQALLMQQEQQQLLHTLLDQLPEAQTDAIRLRFFGELSYEEIALTMNSSVSGAKRRVKNGLFKLAELIRS